MIRYFLNRHKRSTVLLYILLLFFTLSIISIPFRIEYEDDDKEVEVEEVNNKPNKDMSLIYYAPFYSGGGYCNEAIGFAMGIYDQMENLKIVQHGDEQNDKFIDSIPNTIWDKMLKMSKKKLDISKAFVICHSQPYGWVPRGYAADPDPDVWCPTMAVPSEPAYLIGRTMFETDKIPSSWIERLNGFDEIWVPTNFNKQTFKDCGVLEEKVKVIGEPVNVTFYNPKDLGKLDIAKYVPEKHREKVKRSYKFLSIFKWEPRKGWDVLIRAYLTEFNKDDDVVLFILSSTFYLADKDIIPKELSKFINTHVDKPSNFLPLVVFLPEEIPMSDMPKLYNSADAFVLPSRGEGWGLPFVEAMSMELPVLATNWSGNTEYMTEENSYLIKVEKLIKSPIDKKDWNGKGHRWALADYVHLGELMRHLVNNPEEGRKKGKLARKLMVEKYAPEKVTQLVLDRLRQIKNELAKKDIAPQDLNLLPQTKVMD